MSQKSRLETIDRKQSQVSGSALHPIIIGDSGTSTIKVSLKDYPTTTGGELNVLFIRGNLFQLLYMEEILRFSR